MNLFKIRSSAIGLIMTEPQGGTAMQAYLFAESELKRLQELQLSANMSTKVAQERQVKIDNYISGMPNLKDQLL